MDGKVLPAADAGTFGEPHIYRASDAASNPMAPRVVDGHLRRSFK
jgi:hypothetical protein